MAIHTLGSTCNAVAGASSLGWRRGGGQILLTSVDQATTKRKETRKKMRKFLFCRSGLSAISLVRGQDHRFMLSTAAWNKNRSPHRHRNAVAFQSEGLRVL